MYINKNGLGRSYFFLPFEFSILIIVTIFVYKIHLVVIGKAEHLPHTVTYPEFLSLKYTLLLFGHLQ